MTTVTVWILFYLGLGSGGASSPTGAPIAIEKFTTVEECTRVQKLLAGDSGTRSRFVPTTRCIQATVVK